MASADETVRGIERALAEAALRAAMPRVERASRTLARSLRIVPRPSGGLQLDIPYYWALYVHQGRGRLTPRLARVLVWFAVPADDPRHRGRYPVRASQIRRLTPQQYRQGLEANRDRAAQGLPPVMIVSKSSGPVQPNPFFSELHVLAEARPLALQALEAHIRSLVFPLRQKSTAKVRF